ncbi:hypothetical protein LTR08_003383 [Meristemomyces frigidus]|nr:hypothetical protein LTR08_003383 [Meristemomyces frigidus]
MMEPEVPWGVENRLDKYWHLEDFSDMPNRTICRDVQAAGYPGYEITAKSRLNMYRQLVERKVLCYYNCTDAELRLFVKDRGVQLAARRARRPVFNRDKWIRALMDKDATPVFERFLDLPPELRMHVYGWYMAAFPATLKGPSQPPLTRMARLVRQESLPAFYSMCCFEVGVFRFRGRRPSRLHYAPETSGFLKALTAENCAGIRHLYFREGSLFNPWYRLFVDFTGGRVRQTHTTAQDEVGHDFGAEVGVAARAIIGREEKLRLTKDDIYSLCNALDRVLW